MLPRFNVLGPEKWVDSGKFREIRIVPRAEERYPGEQNENSKRRRGVSPGATKRAGKFAREEIANALSALRIRSVNAAMSADYQAVEVVNQARIARFRPRDCQVRSRAPVNAPEFLHVFAVQLAQRHPVEKLQQLLESLPNTLALVDEAIDGHPVIADCQFPIGDFRFRILAITMASDQSAIGNQKSAMLVECVPNFSEGRNIETIDRIAQSIESVKGAAVLGRHLDVDHNRSVITFVAEPGLIIEAAVRAVKTAAESIDLRGHAGVHPRIGATDVLPFVPVNGVTMEECVAIAHRAGERIWQELSIPVYFYERAARRADRVRLEHVRGKGFESLRQEIATNPDRFPDIGETRLHESAGAIAIGARPFLIAFNVNLRTNDLSIARRIARAVRERDGGLPFLKALGFELKSRGQVQVSMNLINYRQTAISHAFDAVQDAANAEGVEIAGTEIVGLLPRAALDREAAYFPLLENFHETLVLENLLESLKTTLKNTGTEKNY